MKARLPKNNSGVSNLQQLAKQAQKMQEEMDKTGALLDEKEYDASSGGGAVNVKVLGSMKVKSIEISPDVVDPEDVEMLSDLVMAAVNEALRAAAEDRESTMEKISGGFNMPSIPGMPGLF